MPEPLPKSPFTTSKKKKYRYKYKDRLLFIWDMEIAVCHEDS